MEEKEAINNEEFYHANLFGEVVDVDLQEDEDEKLPLDKKGKEFNIFAFTDAVAERNKKQAWILLEKALAAGVSSEEVFYKIVWVVKTMLLAKRTESASEAGMKDFPYRKAKENLKKWKEGELEKFSEDLVVGYHEARRGKGEIETLVQKIVLNL